MNERQRRFADEYIISGNAYKSALVAGYSEKYAKTDSHKLLENTRIKSYIDQRLEQLKSEKVADQQEIMEFLTSVIRGEVYEPILVLSGEGTQEIKMVLPNVSTRRAAAVDLGKRYSMWTDKVATNLTVEKTQLDSILEQLAADEDG
ncbi:TPA: terminase small subunit [Streptococcus suis]